VDNSRVVDCRGRSGLFIEKPDYARDLFELRTSIVHVAVGDVGRRMGEEPPQVVPRRSVVDVQLARLEPSKVTL
jgi:hypothetical protein